MASKLQAVEFATSSGIQVRIANGRDPEQLPELAVGRGKRTSFSSAILSL